jgi:hypothetical protein
MNSKPFFFYHAGHLAIDPERPWQLLSAIGCVCGKFRSQESATIALQALIADHQAGTLPNNLGEWKRRNLLNDE